MDGALEAEVVDPSVLTAPVRRALGEERVEVPDWHLRSIHAPFNQATGGLYHITGTGRDRGELMAWSLILKVPHTSDQFLGGSADPFHWNYWKRELLIYQSDDLQELPGIRRPRCYRRPDGSEGPIAIDWAFAGVAPVGAELASLVAASVIFFDAEPDQICQIEELAFDGYLQGLRDVGWDDDPAGVRFVYKATAALRYALFPLGVLLLEDQTRGHLERLWDHPIDDVIDRWVAPTCFLCDRADDARRLVAAL